MRKPAGFSRPRRLTTTMQFGRVFAHPTRSSDRYFTVLSRPNQGDAARLGLTVSRRIAKHAVARNRLKRLAREVFRRQADLTALDFVVLAKRDAPAADNTILRDSLQRHFHRSVHRPD